MFERITEAEINERSMANVSTTPGRRTAFGEGGLDAKALKLRFDRLGRYLAKRLNEVFDGIADGSLAEVLYIDSEGKKRSLKDFVDSLLTGQVESIKIQTSDGVITLTELGDRTQEMYNGLDTGELAGKIKIIEGVTLKKFYEDFLKLEDNISPVKSVNGKIGEVKLSAEDVGARPDSWMPTATEVGARPDTWMPTAHQVGADPSGSATTAVSGHNVQTNAHNDIRLELQRLAGIIADLLDSDDATLDEMHEIVAYIKSNKALIDAITTSKVNVADIIDNLTTNVNNKPLSAAQGVALKALIDEKGGGLDNVESVDTSNSPYTSDLSDEGNGVRWTNQFKFQGEDGSPLAYGPITQKIPIAAGDNVEFEIDEENQVVKIKAAGGSSAESMLGEWVFNDKLTAASFDAYFDFEAADSAGNIVRWHRLSVDGSMMIFWNNDGYNALAYDDGWEDEWFKPINILNEPPAEAAAWIKANGKRKEVIGVDKIAQIYTGEDNFAGVYVDDGISIDWAQTFGLYSQNKFITSGYISQRIPIAAGKNVEFEVDEENQVLKINATGGSGGADESMVGTWVFNDELQGEIEGEIKFIIPDFLHNEREFLIIKFDGSILNAGVDDVYETLLYDGRWEEDSFRAWTILKEPSAEVAAWIKANATKQGGSNSGNSTPFELPQIRFANLRLVDDGDVPLYRFTVENLGGGTLQAGDKLQICCRRSYPGNKKKLRMMAEVEITEEDIDQRFLKIEINPQDERVQKWLFRNDRMGRGTLSALYFRFKRVTKYSDSDGKECNAIFSNVDRVLKTYYVEDRTPDPTSLRIK